MAPDQCSQFTARWPAIKAEWQRLLRGEPVRSPLGRPDTLVFLMDATLLELLRGLQSEQAGPGRPHRRPIAGPTQWPCACGLNPLLSYFTTGELALRAVGQPALGAALEEILVLFRALAQHEVGTLCSVCQHPPRPGCELRRPATPA